jgi:hypothetical protein
MSAFPSTAVFFLLLAAVSILVGGLITGFIFLFRSHGQTMIKKLYLGQFLLMAIAIWLIFYVAENEIQSNPLDGLSGAFQGVEAGFALFVGVGSQIFVMICKPWLLSKAKEWRDVEKKTVKEVA